MDIKTYCKKNGLSQTELANEAGIHPSYITHIIKGRKVPSVAIAILIERVTQGEVSAIKLLGLKK